MAFVTNKDKLVQLTYSFMFSRRDNIWNNIAEFEHDLDKFFISKGLEAEVITFVEGSSGHRTLYLRDVSKDMELKNDKDIFKNKELNQSRPSSSYQTTRKLTTSIAQDYAHKDISKQRKSSSIVNVLTAQLGRRTK